MGVTITQYDLTYSDPFPGGGGTHPIAEFSGVDGFHAYCTGGCDVSGGWSTTVSTASWRLQYSPALTLANGHLRITIEVISATKADTCSGTYFGPIAGHPTRRRNPTLVGDYGDAEWTPGDYTFEDTVVFTDLAWVNDWYIGLSASPSDPEDTVVLRIKKIEWFDENSLEYTEVYPNPPSSVPVANFSGTPLAGGAPLSVAFTDTSTGSPTSWLWDFGDSSSSTLQNPTHIYTADGVYTVALTATNDDGDDTETKVDYVTVASPVADFSGTPTSGTVPLSVAFTDASTNVPTSWFWDFGDGGSSTDQNPTYVYNYIGTYTVTLTATNGSGSDSETKIAYITVNAVVEYGAAIIENCDIDTGGAAVGLRVADVAIARDNRLASITVDASAELRAKDNSYTTLVNNGTLQPLAGDRAVFDALGYAARHTNDADDSVTAIHHTLGTGADQAAAGDHAHAGMGTVTSIATGTGLTGGPITTTGTISDANTGVAAATYGDASNIPQIAVNAQGRITSATNIAISTFTPLSVYNETQTADGVSLTYYLLNIAAPSTIRVYIDGIRQPASDDVAPTDIVTFDIAPDAGALLLFDYEMDTA